jgi:hypothetical protein
MAVEHSGSWMSASREATYCRGYPTNYPTCAESNHHERTPKESGADLMASDQYRSLSPEAVLATLRSLPRRFRAELAHDPSVDVEAAARRGGGVSPTSFVAETAARVSALADAVHRAAVLEHPTVTILPPSTADGGTLDEALRELDSAVAHAAEVIDELPPAAWARRASVTGLGSGATPTELSVLELAQEAARAGAGRLRELATLLKDLRR